MPAGLFFLAVLLTLAAGQAVAEEQGLRPPGDGCYPIRQARQDAIGRTAKIISSVPLHKSPDAHCFSPAENLYMAALLVAQQRLGPNASWYHQMSEENRKKAELGCTVMGYGAARSLAPLDECTEERYSELMESFDQEYRETSIDYIDKRNTMADQLSRSCLSAFYQHAPHLPQQINYPLAYYNGRIHSYPPEFIEKKLYDEQWLLNMQRTMADEVVHDMLHEQCPGEMTWWLYLPS